MDQKLKRIYNYIKNNDSVSDVCAKLNITEEELKGLIEMLRVYGYNVSLLDNDMIQKKRVYKTDKDNIKLDYSKTEEIKLCVISDTHMGNKLEQLTLLNEVYKEANDRGITTVLHCGDLTDGDYRNKRPAHPYELFAQGFDEQTENVIENYPYVEGITTYFIGGNHDATHFINGGATVGKWVSKVRDDMEFLGVNEAYFYPSGKSNFKIKMQHPGGGVSKSLSYKPQEAINKMASGDKPKILLQGHYHKSYYMFYRNVHAFLVPSLVDQSEFMKANDMQNIVGAYFLTININKKGEIEYLMPEVKLFGQKDYIKDDYKTAKRLVIKKEVGK